MLYNFTSRQMGVCVSSTLAEYRKLVPVVRPRQEYIASSRVGQTTIDSEMYVEDENVDAQVKRRKV
jgi:hypothetical protein